MAHVSFKNPPIIEAVAALRFHGSESWTPEDHRLLERALRPLYAGEARQEQEVQVHANFKDGDATAAAKTAAGRLLMPSADNSALVGLGQRLLSVHALKPYPGWAAFEDRIKDAVSVVLENVNVDGLLEVAVRYIDRIGLPAEEITDLSSYFVSIPARPQSMPRTMTAFQCITEAFDADTGTLAALTTAAIPPREDEGFALLYDLNLVRRYPPDGALPAADYLDVVNALHHRQYEIFMESVTDKTRELFA